MLKMTEQTTLAELATYLGVLGHPFLTLMKGLDGRLHAVMHMTSPPGTFQGSGETVAQALESVFSRYRRTTLPDGLKQLLNTPDPRVVNGDRGSYVQPPENDPRGNVPPSDDYGPQCEVRGQCEDIKGDGTCFGCGRWLGDEIQGREVGKQDRRQAHRSETPRRVSDDVAQRITARTRQSISKIDTSRPCHGCTHAYDDHPNDSGCSQWHDGSEFRR